MSIPPNIAVGAAMSAAKLTANAAAELVQGSAKVVSKFAEVLGGQSDVDAASVVSELEFAEKADSDAALNPAAAGTTALGANETLQQMLAGLMKELGLSSESPIGLDLDDHGQVNVTTASPETSSTADSSTRVHLQSHINGNPVLKAAFSGLLRQLPGRTTAATASIA